MQFRDAAGHCADPAATANLRGRGGRLVIYGGERRSWSNWLTTKERINAIFDVLYDGGGVAPRNSCEHLLSIRSCPATGQPIFLILKVKKKTCTRLTGSFISPPPPVFIGELLSPLPPPNDEHRGPFGKSRATEAAVTSAVHYKSLARARWLEIYNRAIIYTYIS